MCFEGWGSLPGSLLLVWVLSVGKCVAMGRVFVLMEVQSRSFSFLGALPDYPADVVPLVCSWPFRISKFY